MWRKKKKVFCIGRNKTGTTSVARALELLGYRVGEQASAEVLIEDWARRDFSQVIKYCRSAEAFQDVPFSLDYTYQAVDAAFPGSKFVLTVRRSPDEWYRSLTRFHSKLISNGKLPTAEDLKNFPYREKGWIWRAQQLIYGVDEDSLYERDRYINHYVSYNERVMDYFSRRASDLLILELGTPGALEMLSGFLGRSPGEAVTMPHLNQS